MEENTNINSNRRAALKALAAATGAAGLAALPSQWSKPAVMVGAIPAHAQASACFEYALDLGLAGPVDGFYASEEPDLVTGERAAWFCGAGCLSAGVVNTGDAPESFTVAVFGSIFFMVDLDPAQEWYIVVNRDTLQHNHTSGILNDSLWTDIGCASPL